MSPSRAILSAAVWAPGIVRTTDRLVIGRAAAPRRGIVSRLEERSSSAARAGRAPRPRTRRDGRTDGNGRYGRAAEAKRNPAPLTGPCAQSVTKSAAEARPPDPAPLGKPQ